MYLESIYGINYLLIDTDKLDILRILCISGLDDGSVTGTGFAGGGVGGGTTLVTVMVVPILGRNAAGLPFTALDLL